MVSEADPATHGQSHDQSHVQSESHDQLIIEEHVVEDGSKIHDDEEGALVEQVVSEVDYATHDQSHGQSHDQSIIEEHVVEDGSKIHDDEDGALSEQAVIEVDTATHDQSHGQSHDQSMKEEHIEGDGSKIHDNEVNNKENSETCVRNEVDSGPLACEDGEDDKLVEDGHSNDGDDSFDSSFDEAEIMSGDTENDTNLNNKVSIRSRRHNVSKPARLRDGSNSASKRTKSVSMSIINVIKYVYIHNEINIDPDTSCLTTVKILISWLLRSQLIRINIIFTKTDSIV